MAEAETILADVPAFWTPERNDVHNPSRSNAQERSDAIFTTLRHRICTARFAPGMVLHEASLAEEFGVSRSPIRRVFARLEQAHLLEIRHGVGARVTEVETEKLIDIYRVRMMLAASSGPFFVQPLPEGTPEFFDRCTERFEAVKPGDICGFGDVNTYYFIGFLNLIESPALRRMHEQLFYESARIWLVRLPIIDWKETVDVICNEMMDLKRRAIANDPEGLAFELRSNFRQALSRFGAHPFRESSL